MRGQEGGGAGRGRRGAGGGRKEKKREGWRKRKKYFVTQRSAIYIYVFSPVF